MSEGSHIVICKQIKGGLDQMEPKVKGKFVTSLQVKIFKILSVKQIRNNKYKLLQ